jgi:hypothetical protein
VVVAVSCGFLQMIQLRANKTPSQMKNFQIQNNTVGDREHQRKHRHKTTPKTNITHPKHGLMNLTALVPNFSFLAF